MSANQLQHETSLYLRQHARNPVHWQPWGPAALERAKKEQKPIFLSIGYSACHWCHVMEHESFEDESIAAFLNEHFINIKVDREERPDLDGIYMNAVVALTGQGGWPMSVFLTPSLQPFYGGTYFPPADRGGMPSFRRILEAVRSAWSSKKEQVIEQAEAISAALAEQMKVEARPGGSLDEEILRHARDVLARAYDPRYGGFGRAPKFPHPFDLRLLMRLGYRFQDSEALEMARHTLERMARGGIYDQIAGGFHRYSTDQRWLVPHFEKMLYDNALLVPAYLDAFQLTGDLFFRRIAQETLGWVEREMTAPGGAFFSTTDADSEGEEGKFFVWKLSEIEGILGPDAEFAAEVFDISSQGNWEGHTILTRPKTDAQEAALRGIPVLDFLARLESVKERLRSARDKRIKPGRDEKILTAWNALMIAAFAQAARILDQPRYAQTATRAADFVLRKMLQPDGRLFRTALDEGPAKLNGYLEDYSFMIDALVHLYESTFDPRWLRSADGLAVIMIDQFADEAGGFFFTGKDHETLIIRDMQPHDNAVPSGNSVAATALQRLGRLVGNTDYLQQAEKTLRRFSQGLREQSTAFGQMLIALDDYLGPIEEFAVFVPDQDEEHRIRRLLAQTYRPRTLLAGREDGSFIPLLRDRSAVNGRATVYRCIQQTCERPWVGWEEIHNHLAPR